MTLDKAGLTLNRDCYCWPIKRVDIIANITAQNAHADMAGMLAKRPHYFASTSVFLSADILAQMTAQIDAIEAVIDLPAYRDAVRGRDAKSLGAVPRETRGVFMGYDFHITGEGPRLIEINSNAGGAFIVDQVERSVGSSSGKFADEILSMFQSEWTLSGREKPLRTIAIVDTDPEAQYHYPDMCLAKALLEAQGLTVVITDPTDLRLSEGQLFHGETVIDLVYNRLTDFSLSEPQNEVIAGAYREGAAVVTPAPHHHVLYADKRNLILLSDPKALKAMGASAAQIETLSAIPGTQAVTAQTAEDMWARRRQLFFKPQAGFGSRGAFRGAKLTKKVWADIISGGYIAQAQIAPPLRAVTVDGEKGALKFDVRVYTYDGQPLLLAARVYQGQTTNLRTAGGGLAPVIAVPESGSCAPAPLSSINMA